MEQVKRQLQTYADLLEKTLENSISSCPYPESLVTDAMKYSLLGGGKRIRGALVLAFYRLLHDDITPALPFAGALEMIHAYSLIHDDLPCMDDDDMRRGRPSCHVAHGEATALLAGDGLLTLAFETMTDPRNTQNLAPDVVVRAVRCLSLAAGCQGMIGGQVIDLYQEGREPSEELLLRTCEKKTGALIRAAGELGCILAETDGEATLAAVSYCNDIGLAFQIVDDILDVSGDTAILGKPVGSDRENEKCTWVTVYGLEAARREVEKRNHQAKEVLGQLPGNTSFLSSLVDLLAGREN